VGEFTILLGAWGAGAPGAAFGSYLYAGLSAVGVILAAVYILFMFQKMFLGAVTKEENKGLKDLNWREIIILVPLLVLIFWIGLYPKPFFGLMEPAVNQLVSTLQAASLAGLP
jgi:NADH-quinone oxidoreductase subunit M